MASRPETAFAALLDSLDIRRGAHIAVACSGGGDSMALALLAGMWGKSAGVGVTALTVDHRLRKESAAEAKQVAKWLKGRGIPHVTLAWQGKKPASNIQEAARKARYRLLAEHCAKQGIAHVLVAHHLEDQAETFLLRLARGSGVDGLSAMAARTELYGITLLRPLLGVSKAELLAYLKKHKQPYVNDPSNEDEKHDRVKLRKLLPSLAPLGLTPERLARTAATMARARAHLEEETGKFLAQQCNIFPEGYATLSHVPASEEIALRALATLIMLIGGHEVKTRLDDLLRLYHALEAPGFKSATLGGCIFKSDEWRVASDKKKRILIFRENKAIAAPVSIKTGETLVWDSRFEIRLHSPHDTRHSYFLGALGQSGWLFVEKNHGIKNMLPDKRILYTLPALRDKSGWLHAVPHLGLSVEDMKCSVAFNAPG